MSCSTHRLHSEQPGVRIGTVVQIKVRKDRAVSRKYAFILAVVWHMFVDEETKKLSESWHTA